LLMQKLYLTQGVFTFFFMLASVTEHPLQAKCCQKTTPNYLISA
jgi:hypothetical protein